MGGDGEPSPTARRAPPGGSPSHPSAAARWAEPVPAARGAPVVWRDELKGGFPRLAADPVPAGKGRADAAT